MAHEAKARKRMAGEPPARSERIPVGTVLHRIRVESPVFGQGFEIVVKRGRRANGIVAESFGRASKEHGFDWLCKHLRKRLVVKEIQYD